MTQHTRGLLVRVGRDDHELRAADAAQEVAGSQRGNQHFGKIDKHLIATE